MKVLVVLSFDLPKVEQIADVMDSLNPPMHPHFAGEARIVVEPVASKVTTYLDDGPEEVLD